MSRRLSCLVSALALGLCTVLAATGCGGAAGGDKYGLVQPGKLTFAMSGQFRPFNFYDGSGKLVGFDVEIGNEIAKRLKLDPNPVTGPFNSLVAGLKSRRYDAIIGSMAPTDERKRQVSFSQDYYVSGAQLFVRGGSPIKSKDDLKGATVGVALGTTFEKYARSLPGVKEVKTYGSDNQTLVELQNGRLDAAITNKVLGLYEIKHARLNVTAVGGSLYRDPAGIPVRKDSGALRTAIDKALNDMKKDGTYSRISEKWFGTDISKNS